MTSDGLLLAVKRAGRRFGLELLRYNPTNALDAQRAQLLRRHEVDLVVDGGANEGQWARDVRRAGYRGPLVSYEPLGAVFEKLAVRARRDGRWEARQVALDRIDGQGQINVSANSWSSSLLEMTDQHLQVDPRSGFVGAERIQVRRLDGEELPPVERIMLKLDVQGAELRALEGAEGILDRIVLAELEVSLVELYAGAPLLPDVVGRLRDHGYRLAGFAPSLVDPVTAELAQGNALFLRGGE